MNSRTYLVAAGILALALILLGLSSVFVVQQTQQALVLQFGEPKRVIQDPGLQFKIPFLQEVVFLDKRILTLDAPTEEIIASDQRRLLVDSFARYRIVDALKFYQSVHNELGARGRLSPSLNSSLRGVLGNQDSASIISSERANKMRQIRDQLNGEAAQFGIEVVDVRIKRADYPDTISQAIFRRMQTEREREAKQNRAEGFETAEKIRADADRQRTVILADARKLSEITRGEGDAERTHKFAAAASQDPEFYSFYRSLQAYRSALQPGDTTMVLSPNSEFFRYFTQPPGSTRGGAARPAQ